MRSLIRIAPAVVPILPGYLELQASVRGQGLNMSEGVIIDLGALLLLVSGVVWPGAIEVSLYWLICV